MWTVQQNAQFVLRYTEFKSIVEVQRKWGRISRTTTHFKEDVERIGQSCVKSPKRSIARRSLALGIPKTTIQNVLHKRLRLHANKIQLRHDIKPEDKPKRVEFATFILLKIDDEESFLNRILFRDEATFHFNGCVNHYNCRIWGSQQPIETHQYFRGSPKVNVWCGLLFDRVVGPSFFTGPSITGNIFQDLLETYVFPQIDDLEAVTGNNIVFMQKGAPPHFSLSLYEALHERFPNTWIGCPNGPILWPARDPDLTPLDFFL
ncbi:hypothetical protein AVEN_163881-1 [Araneus ventricosus]|uniref:Transposable element Tc3 transposase n=1 Tax=Araneus ventricosus TaxID=182803 RepID=A0A4Y2H5V4_ARAVE|nr:hypothetical protein AVEN_163881-1 [Araneus ventricosus]